MADRVVEVDRSRGCADCPLAHIYDGSIECTEVIGDIDINENPDWCPLRSGRVIVQAKEMKR